MDEIEILERVGGGAFGVVHRGVFRATEVAVKLVPAGGGAAALDAFLKEAAMLARLRHPNVCLFMGASFEEGADSWAIVTEYVANGSLWDALRVAGGRWPVDRQRAVAAGVARGLAYLHAHAPPVLHRDVKSPNVLVDAGDRVKLCDVGLARDAAGGAATAAALTAGCGTPQWMAPEILEARPYATAADVYAYGVVLSEILTGACPYEEHANLGGVALAMRVVRDGLRPSLPAGGDAALASLAVRCWARAPASRPRVDAVLAELEGRAPPSR